MTSTMGMSDEDIRENLLKLGVNIGPVVDSTREFYRRKLARLLGENIKTEDVCDEEPVSDSEETEATEETVYVGATEFLQKEKLFSETYKPPSEIRARRSIHANIERTPQTFSSNVNRSYVSANSSEAESTISEPKNTKVLCFMLGVALLCFIIYFYSSSTEVALIEK